MDGEDKEQVDGMKTTQKLARAAELKRISDLEAEVADFRLHGAEKDVEIATLKRQVTNLLRDRENQDRRIQWIAKLTNYSNRPRDLHDPEPPK